MRRRTTPEPTPLGSTSKGLPYPAATDPVAGGAAAMQALAEGVDAKLGRWLVSDTALGSAGSPLTIPLPSSGFTSLELLVELFAPSGTADNVTCDVTLDLLPAGGAGQWTYGAAGQGTGAGYASNAATVPLGRWKHHSANGAAGASPLYFARIVLLPFLAARRHGLLYDVISRQDVAGAAADVNLLQGGAQWRANGAQAIPTSLVLAGSSNFGAGSHGALYGQA